MKKHEKYQSISGSGISIAGENIIKDKSRVKNIFISVDVDCGVSFNGGDFVKIKSGCDRSFEEFCTSVVFNADGVGYDFSGEVAYCPMSAGGTGHDGKSAYELAVEHGFIGTEEEWLEDIKGDKGDKGDPGLTSDELDVFRAQVAWGNAKVGVEYWTGKTVGDTGKKIYGKVVTCNKITNNGRTNISHGILNLKVDSNIKVAFMSSNPSLGQTIAFNYTFGSTSSTVYTVDADNIIVSTNTTWDTWTDTKIIMEYTCSDR